MIARTGFVLVLYHWTFSMGRRIIVRCCTVCASLDHFALSHTCRVFHSAFPSPTLFPVLAFSRAHKSIDRGHFLLLYVIRFHFFDFYSFLLVHLVGDLFLLTSWVFVDYLSLLFALHSNSQIVNSDSKCILRVLRELWALGVRLRDGLCL